MAQSHCNNENRCHCWKNTNRNQIHDHVVATVITETIIGTLLPFIILCVLFFMSKSDLSPQFFLPLFINEKLADITTCDVR
jgi:hypothetical protein